MHVYCLYALCTHTAVMRTRTLRAYLPLLASMHVWHACISMHMLRTPVMHLSCIRLMHDVRMYGNYMYCVTVTMYGIFMLHTCIAYTNCARTCVLRMHIVCLCCICMLPTKGKSLPYAG